MARYTVIYDACVLYPAPLRDLLIQLATANLFRARWTNEIHEEWIRNVLADRPDLKPENLARTRSLMDTAIPDCLVTGYAHLVSVISLPDPDDRHVVAAAIHARADAIVTFNLKDFPQEQLGQYYLEAIHPDEFIQLQYGLNEAAVVIAAQTCCARLKNPPKTSDEYLNILEAQSLPKTVSTLREFAGVLSPHKSNKRT